MIIVRTQLFLVVIAVGMLMPYASVAEKSDDILIIVNKSNREHNLSIDDVKMYFLKKRTTWKKGGKVVPIHAKSGSKLKNEFINRVLNMNQDKEKTYWRNLKIQVGVSKPLELSNIQKAVFNLKGAIGYVYRSQYLDRVSTIALVVPPPEKKGK